MEKHHGPGLYLYERMSQTPSPVLKELLQLSKTVAQGKSSGFSFVHGQSSLIPHLSLWENLQLSAPHEFWDDFVKDHHPIVAGLIPLLKEPYKKASVSLSWECFIISLMRGILEPNPNLLVDIHEHELPVFTLKTIKSTLMRISADKCIFLSSPATSLWLDCAHHLVKKNGYGFVFEKLDAEEIKRHWAA